MRIVASCISTILIHILTAPDTPIARPREVTIVCNKRPRGHVLQHRAFHCTDMTSLGRVHAMDCMLPTSLGSICAMKLVVTVVVTS